MLPPPSTRARLPVPVCANAAMLLALIAVLEETDLDDDGMLSIQVFGLYRLNQQKVLHKDFY
jgi:hypothetical protein